MDLYLMRHAEAEESSGNDFSRILTEKGKSQAASVGIWFNSVLVGPIRVVTSPLTRAYETAEIVAGNLAEASAVQLDERMACGITPDAASALIQASGGEKAALLLVGHAPDLGILASHLIGAPAGTIEMKKAALACFACDRPGFGGSVLQWLVTPKILPTTAQ